MIGQVKQVDVEMLEEYDIVRLKVYVKDPTNIPHRKEYAVDGDIYYIYFSLDSVIDPGCIYRNRDSKSGGSGNSKNEWSDQEPSHTEPIDGKLRVQPHKANTTETGKKSKEPSDCCSQELEGLRECIVSTESDDMSPKDVGTGQVKDDGLEASGEKKMTLQGKYDEKGDSVHAKQQVRQSTLYSLGKVCMSSSAIEETPPQVPTKEPQVPPKEYIALKKVVPNVKVNLFAHYCKAVEHCPNNWTICHVCSMEGVSDMKVKLSEMELHISKYHDGDEITFECNECHTRARSGEDIRTHYHFAHTLPKGWWKNHIDECGSSDLNGADASYLLCSEYADCGDFCMPSASL